MHLLRKLINSKFSQRLKRKAALSSGIYLKLKKFSPSVSEEMRTAQLLKHYNITKVLDIGANTGQFGESLLDFGYKGKIVSFEPVDSAYRVLCNRAKNHKNWIVAEQCAIGDMDGEIEINVSESTDLSSIKKIKTDYSQKEKVAGVVKKEKTPIYKLDSLLGKYYNYEEKLFLKIDTQGFEKEVIMGSSKLMEKLSGIKLEIPVRSDWSIYEGIDWDLKYYMDFLYASGFVCVSMEAIHVEKETGIVKEIDGIFFRDI